ncbi:MAG: tRNA lysidine(34) synthetase TilS, partial [Halocynthiibacter sp.]
MSAEFDDLLEMAGGAFQTERPACIGVAVSGGSDSMALLCLLSQLCERHKAHRLSVVTVDHGLRPDAAAEATHVAETCAGLGHQHTVLHWRGWDRSGNLQDRARQARYSLIADWATASGISTVALGHTADDQAENFLIRLARESGVDGLSGMSSRRKIKDVMFLRPMLTATRSELRDFLRDRGIRWVDDPS